MTHEVLIVGSIITTPRLRLRPWHQDDAAGALDIYGSPEVSRWLAPAMDRAWPSRTLIPLSGPLTVLDQHRHTQP